jgi:hypothetical protein
LSLWLTAAHACKISDSAKRESEKTGEQMKLIAKNQNGLAMVAQFEFMKLMWNFRRLIELMAAHEFTDHVKLVQEVALAGCQTTPFAVPADISQTRNIDEGWSQSMPGVADLGGQFVISFGARDAGYLAVVNVELSKALPPLAGKPPMEVSEYVDCSRNVPYCLYKVVIHLHVRERVLDLERGYKDDNSAGSLWWLDRLAMQSELTKRDMINLTDLIATFLR